MKRHQSILVSSVLIASLVSFGLGLFFAENINLKQPANIQTAQTNKKEDPLLSPLKIRDLDEVWQRLRSLYYDSTKLDSTKLEYSAVKGFVAGVGDPYTVFMPPEEAKDFEQGLDGKLEGIGAELEVKEDKLIIVAPLKNSPAEAAGVKAGDVILKINDESAPDMTLYEAIRRIRGKKGTQVTLTLFRENQPQPFEITITRDEILIDTVTVKKIDGGIYHVAVNQFNDHTKTEFQKAIEEILLSKAKAVILDLRGNGGGFLDISIDILSEIIAGEKTAVIVKKRDQTQNEVIKTTGAPRAADIPLVVLVDKGSASASEIVAGAIQDYRRGIVIGEKTFGKGSVQELINLNDGSSLRMTIAKWFTPLNRSIDETGIAPDKEVKITEEDVKAGRDPQLEAAVQYLKTLK
ncbi:S41 family peptidase [Candidatus Peregrinibacteria bacterium]|nr:S41 family peptidase [Candidatus Peregrinibacteria bacterium]